MRNIYLYKGKLWEEIHNFLYTGEMQQFNLTKGDYFVLCDGARGGTGYNDMKTYGGRAMGILKLKKDSTFYAAVGGEGTAAPDGTTPGVGGWNGGANGGLSVSSTYSCGSGGGGASDIRLSNDESTVKLDQTVIDDFPEGYTQLKYIYNNTNNGGYIDTEYKPRANTNIETKAYIPNPTANTTWEWQALFAAGNDTSRGTFQFFVYYSSTYKAVYGCGTYEGGGTDTNNMVYNKDIIIKTEGSTIKWIDDGNEYSITAPSEPVNVEQTMYLFGRHNYDGRNVCNSNARIYYFKIFEDDTLVHHFIPAKRNSDSKIGLYDLVDNTFKTGSYVYGEAYGNTITTKSYLSRIIVAGGAGGGTHNNAYDRIDNVEFIGSGGSTIGTYAGYNTSSFKWPTDRDGYSFGQGQVPLKKTATASYGAEGSGGGGGGWFGGYADHPVNAQYSSGAGGGGSSYALTSTSWTPPYYTPDNNYYFTDTFFDAGVAEYGRVIVAKEVDILKKNDVIYSFCTGETEKMPVSNKLVLDIECYGGAGGVRSRFVNAGRGGYAKGTVTITSADELYLTVGGTGLGHNVFNSVYNQILRPTLGFNGGGAGGIRGNIWHACGYGGGATDVRICPKPTKQTLPTNINYIKTSFYERRVEYIFDQDVSATPWFNVKTLFFYKDDEKIDIETVNAYTDENCTKPTVNDSPNASLEQPEVLLTGSRFFACKWENLVNIVMKTSSPVSSIDAYSINLPSSYSLRDPAAWKVYVSENGEDWVLLDNRFTLDSDILDTDYMITKEEFELRDKPTHHNRVIVAGGAGGQGGTSYIAGNGGGLSGGVNTTGNAHQQSGPGTQYSAPYGTSYGQYGCDAVFGHGGKGNKYNDSCGRPGGGGGWFGGSGIYYSSSSDSSRSGCGGSGYVLTSSSWKPPCYALNSDYYMTDTVLSTGGNTLPIVATMIKMTVKESSPVLILAGDRAGTKYFDEDEEMWVNLSDDQPTLSDFESYGTQSVPNFEGLNESFKIYAISKIEQAGTTIVPTELQLTVVPKKLKIHHTGSTSMRVRKLTADIEYDSNVTDVRVSAEKVGVGPTAHLDIDVVVDKHSVNTIEKLYSVYLEAGLDQTGNRYIPVPEEAEEDNTPRPRPGDDDYVKKYLLQVGARNNIPREFKPLHTMKFNDQTISTVVETCSKVYDREIYSFLRLTYGSTTVHRFIKYNTITKTPTLIHDFTDSLFGGYGVGDFVKIGDIVVISSGYNNGHYYWATYNMASGALTTVSAGNSSYYTTAFGKMYQISESEVAICYRYGVIIYDVLKNTWEAKSGVTQTQRDFCVGNTYYMHTYNSSTIYLQRRDTYAASTLALPLNSATVCTFYGGKFYVAQNGYLHIINESTLEIEKSIIVPWADCRTISYQTGIVYVTTNNSARLWIYDIGDSRYDSTMLPWSLTFNGNGTVMRGIMYNNSWWIAHWTMGSVSYVGTAKYNFGQKYGQYQVGFNSETVDELEFDDHFVTQTETHLEIHDGDLIYESTQLPTENKISVFEISKKDYNIYKSIAFNLGEAPVVDETDEEESETQ